MTANLPIMFPANPAVFGAFLAVIVVMAVYWIAKFVISLWTGA